MFRSYLILAFRNLRKNKAHSIINIFGLSVGLALGMLIFLFVRHERSYDRFHEKSDRILRVWRTLNHPTRGEFPSVFVPYVFGEVLNDSYSEVKNVVRLARILSVPVRKGENVFTENVHLASPDFFEVFSFRISKGNAQRPLDDLNSVVITEEVSKKYFGELDPVGKELLIRLSDREESFTVTAVTESTPDNSSIDFDFLINFERSREVIGPIFFESWRAAFAEMYIELSNNTTFTTFEKKKSEMASLYESGLGDEMRVSLNFQKLSELHLSTEVNDEVVQTSDPLYSYMLSGLGILILFIAGVNFMTLSLARSMDRTKEVGIRKVMGAIKSQLIQQYLCEALLITFFSLLFGLALAQMVLPVFNEISGKELIFSFDSTFVLFSLLLVSLIGLSAGAYPAMILARFDPAVVLRKLTKIRSKSLLSRTLVVLQFSITVFLITATLIMHRQLNFMKEKNLGYDRERIIQIPLASQESEAERTFKLYKNELERDNRIIGVAAAMNPFGLEWATLGYTDEFGNEIRFVFNQVTYNFVETMGMEIVEGRDFSEEYATDYHDAMIVNKAFLRRLGWQTGIDQTLPEKFNRDMRIVGVVSDFHIGSLHEEIRPLALTLSRIPLSKIEYGRGIGNSVSLSSVIIRIAAGETQPVLDFLRAKWQRVAVNQPFDHEFLDRTIDAQYRQEQRWGEIINYSSVLAIAIASLGLFSLVSLSLERRVKEIGIRKVLGASVRGIVTKLSKDFVKLVLVANVIAWPVAWYVMNRWLQDFAYRIDIGWWVFTLAAGLALAIALLTVSTQAIRAALANPIEALKYE